MEDPIVFALAAATVLVAPGPTNTLLASAGASGGFRRSLHLLIAALAGYLLTIFILGGLIGSLLPDRGRTVLSLLAGLYLAVLAARLWRLPPESAAATVRWQQVFVTTLLNPKGLVLAFAVVPRQSERAWLYIAALAMIAAVAGSIWIGAGVLLGRAGGGRVRGMVPKATSAALGVLAVVLIASSLAY